MTTWAWCQDKWWMNGNMSSHPNPSSISTCIYIHKESQTADQKSELQTFVVSLKVDITNFCSLKKWTLPSFVVSKIKNTTCQKSRLQTFVISKTQKADPTKFCSLKGQGYYISEKRTTNFCSLKKRTLPSFVVSKIKTTCQKSGLQTFVVLKVKDTTNHMSEKQTINLCNLKKRTLQTFVVSKSIYYKLV